MECKTKNNRRAAPLFYRDMCSQIQSTSLILYFPRSLILPCHNPLFSSWLQYSLPRDAHASISPCRPRAATIQNSRRRGSTVLSTSSMFAGDDPKRFVSRPTRAQRSKTWIVVGGIAACLILLLLHNFTRPGSLESIAHQSAGKSRDFDALCSAYGAERTDVAQRIILQTKPVSIGQRRLLHNHLVTVPTVLKEGPSCMAFNNVPRIEHPRAPKTAPNEMFFSLATKAARIAFDGSICAHWLNNSNVHLMLTLPHNDDPFGENLAESFLSKLGLASYHISRATDGTSYEESWAEAYPRMLEIATTQKFKVDYYSKLAPGPERQ